MWRGRVGEAPHKYQNGKTNPRFLTRRRRPCCHAVDDDDADENLTGREVMQVLGGELVVMLMLMLVNF